MQILVETFNRDRLIESCALFGGEFEDRKRFVYHGTSRAYSRGIEASGLSPGFQAVDPTILRELADSLPVVEQSLATTIRTHADHPTRLGFAAYSFAAVDFALKSGGQILSLCRKCVSCGANVPAALQELFDKLSKETGCVYAIELQELPSGMTFEHGVIQSAQPVGAQQIRARVDLPSGFGVDDFLTIKGRPPLYHARLENGSLSKRLWERGLGTPEDLWVQAVTNDPD